MYKRILVAFDGSNPSRNALDHAVSIAVQWKAELKILSVVPRTLMPIIQSEEFGTPSISTAQIYIDHQEGLKALYIRKLQEAENDVKKIFPGLKVCSKLLEGRPSRTIVEEAERDDAELIVIGSRGIGGITGWILGSTSQKVVNSCTKPVLVVKTVQVPHV
jgi:nucleotide-binding universal stress UspA family protein